jgi:hypothetical protein
MSNNNTNVNWTEVEQNLSDGSLTKIEQFATKYTVSRPTAKKMLSDHFGSRLLFKRGRNGGMVFNASVTAVNP